MWIFLLENSFLVPDSAETKIKSETEKIEFEPENFENSLQKIYSKTFFQFSDFKIFVFIQIEIRKNIFYYHRIWNISPVRALIDIFYRCIVCCDFYYIFIEVCFFPKFLLQVILDEEQVYLLFWKFCLEFFLHSDESFISVINFGIRLY